MLLSRKPAVLLSSYTSLPSLPSLPSFYYPHAPAHSSSPSHPARCYAQHAAGPDPSSHSRTQPQSQSRPQSSPQFPSQSHSHCDHDHADLVWPEPLHPHKTPTPYQILAVRRGDAYTKQRFYLLAKLYHPDRCHASSPVAHLPHAVRLERYRLLVAAHSILSDNSKRRAYDLWGTGWVGHHHPNAPNTQPEWRPEQRVWPSGHDPSHNATWEDWERWYDREYQRDGGDARTVHMSNFGFVSLVFALVSLGGIMQGTRANMFSATVIEHRDKVHKEASMELMKAKRASMATGDRNERIRTFLEHREATMVGEDPYQRLLPPAENCAPDSVRKQ